MTGKRRWLWLGICVATAASAGFLLWQNLDAGVRVAKSTLLADQGVRQRLGEISYVQLVGYTHASPSDSRGGYREYRWYVWGSRSSGRVDVVANYDVDSDPAQFAAMQVR